MPPLRDYVLAAGEQKWDKLQQTQAAHFAQPRLCLEESCTAPEAMKTRTIHIGNSKGVRIPNRLLEQAGLHGDVEIRVENDTPQLSVRLVLSEATS